MLQAAAAGAVNLTTPGLVFGNDKADASGNPVASKKSCIFVLLCGGPSHVDTFDYKPDLIAADGKDHDFVGVRTGTFGKKSKRRLMKPLWEFKKYGQCGQPVSSLFPHIAKQVDDLAFVH